MKEICGICLEYIDEDDEGELLPCKHKYHISCIRNWHLHSKDFKCPTCRKESASLYCKSDGVEIDLKYWCNINLVEEFSKLDLHKEREIRELQCALCGQMDADVNLYCESCETLFHMSCLNTLRHEVGESEWRCTECHSGLKPLVSRRWQDSQFRDPNARIFGGRIRDRRSILTECIYNNVKADYSITYEDKCKVQGHVRSVLDSFYKERLITRDKYAEINKIVSRKLYQISKGKYDPSTIDYEAKAKILIEDAI